MAHFLYQWDAAFFSWVNQSWSRPFLDAFFAFVTDYKNFNILFVLLLIYFFWKGGSRGRWLVLSMALAILLADQISSHLLKEWVGRVRPCNALPGVLTPVGKSSSFSFPSSHAANMGASMFLLSLYYRPWTWAFAAVALIVGLSRVYLGLHYPSDVLGGYALGIGVGSFVGWGVEKLKSSIQNRQRAKITPSQDRKKSARKKR